MAAGPDCAPLPARPSTRCAAPSASPCRPSSRRCRPPPEPRLWCLKLRMARKPLIINVVQIETAEVGLKANYRLSVPPQSKHTLNYRSVSFYTAYIFMDDVATRFEHHCHTANPGGIPSAIYRMVVPRYREASFDIACESRGDVARYRRGRDPRNGLT